MLLSGACEGGGAPMHENRTEAEVSPVEGGAVEQRCVGGLRAYSCFVGQPIR